jgi:hypothetical protein
VQVPLVEVIEDADADDERHADLRVVEGQLDQPEEEVEEPITIPSGVVIPPAVVLSTAASGQGHERNQGRQGQQPGGQTDEASPRSAHTHSL